MGQVETLRSLARSYDNRGDYAQAVAVSQEAVSILESLGPPRRRELAGAIWEMARSEFYRSNYAEAEQAVDRSDRILDQLTEDLSFERGQNLTLRGSLAQRWQGDLERSAELLTAALAEKRKTGVPRYVADGLNSLALAKMERGQLDEAASLLEEATAITREVYGEGSPSLALQLENLGNIRYRQGDYDTTAKLLGQVLAIREQVYGADSFPVAKTRFNTGVVTMKAGDFRQALKLVDGAIPVFRQHTGEQSFEMVGALRIRGECREGLGDDTSALADYRAALAITDQIDAPSSSNRLGILKNLATLLCRRGSTANARQTANLALAALEPDNPGHEHWRTTFQELLESCGN